jgi:hypothetical protein
MVDAVKGDRVDAAFVVEPFLSAGVASDAVSIVGWPYNAVQKRIPVSQYVATKTFISQNPTELIEIPFDVTDTSLYYYLDLFNVDGGTLKSTATTNGGTYLTISPLQGGGIATGGPGGTPGTQWISSGSNIYFSNSVGIGAINPAYNLDVSTGTTATRLLITSNISSLGIYGPTLNINSNVIVSANLAVGGGGVPLISPPYALYVTGQGYFSNAVSYENFAGFRNRLVNGTFRITNRANSITISNTSVFILLDKLIK